jgi:hypothetical protein
LIGPNRQAMDQGMLGNSRSSIGQSRSIDDVVQRLWRNPLRYQGESMSAKKENDIVRINLTSEQSDKIKAEIGRGAEAIELRIEELEERITPNGDRLASNHNETLLFDGAE